MKIIAMIPARYAATRFPFKLMKQLGTKTVIRHTYDNTVATGLFAEVYVVTDSELIFNEIVKNGGKAIMSVQQHESGSDRIAEAVENIDADVVLNVQGDEPFVKKEPVNNLLKVFEDKQVQVASVMKKITNQSLLHNPNYVKVVTDKNKNALYFSRSPIPYLRDEKLAADYYEHIGVYAFQKKALMRFAKWPASKLEQYEKLEQLRYLENGVAIRMVETSEETVKIDVPEDLAAAEKYLLNFKNF
ncbi:MAG: 3-deoxy-manno-octulosonate cytidylyltransferase [Chitinophagaceae bacterium]|jgi:3-deoxy-manno-octulosonate cytidylyltransferase (CMP-KDO synthetase)|nr:MAG: 3-deoxy-manno-octulosonate cytidylyltransferase [Chitinophagaceae bacterium]HOV43963.1 3-deoxy-manno-octulosonate cytidylyltransferase [Ferruginibacter sp.]HAO03474.1 3-deoxy-manno-octulosonate cytidylyltransferase [Chitinophagaceae bacterium]HQV44639.1 3-deoxy-manno-octulosonate cytidylyltransferase [Ferruginibacter sp.]HQW62943.1 3-deoxy-manno-octulosonate cytidylyltransferase [Ferruginibacter sp.]